MRSSPKFHLAIAGLLVALFMLQSLLASLQKSPVYDEPPHIASGLSYIETGVFRANLQHPPLLKEISAVFLSLAGIHWPKTEDAQAVIRGTAQGENADWPVGNDIIYTNGPDRVLFWARLPFILMGGLLGFLIYWWGRELVGSAAALGALFLYAFDPTLIAHSALVTTDLGLALFGFLFLWNIWRYAHRPTRLRLVVCGLVMGAMLGTKFSSLFYLPMAALLLAASVRWPEEGVEGPLPDGRGSESEYTEVGAARVSKRSFARVAPNSPCPCGSGKKYKKCHGAGGALPPASRGPQVIDWRKLAAFAGALAAMCAIALVVLEGLYFFPRDPFLYLEGLRKVNADHLAGYNYYFHGVLSREFYGYFVSAWLLKEPLATVLLVAAGLYVLARHGSLSRLTKLTLLLPPALFVLAMTIFADDMGVRYIIPAMPFLYLVGGMGLAALLTNGPAWARWTAGALCLWLAIAAVGIYPDHLSYFNESACLLESPGEIGLDGGTRCGPLWLDDSNVDWGQSLKELRDWQNRHPDVPPVHLAYPDVFPPDGYGLKFIPWGAHNLLPEPKPGWYAVSAALVARMPAAGAEMRENAGWLRRIAPTAIAGHAYYLYDIK